MGNVITMDEYSRPAPTAAMWLNTKAMEEFGINREAVEKWGTDTACGLTVAAIPPALKR